VNEDVIECNRMEVAPKPDGVLDLQTENNERLEFIGDSLLGCSIALYL